MQNEKQDRTRDINLSQLRAQFANLRGAITTNLDTNRGLGLVIQSIRKELESLPHIGVGLPATYAGMPGAEVLADLRARAGAHRPQLAQGSAFAAKARDDLPSPEPLSASPDGIEIRRSGLELALKFTFAQ